MDASLSVAVAAVASFRPRPADRAGMREVAENGAALASCRCRLWPELPKATSSWRIRLQQRPYAVFEFLTPDARFAVGGGDRRGFRSTQIGG